MQCPNEDVDVGVGLSTRLRVLFSLHAGCVRGSLLIIRGDSGNHCHHPGVGCPFTSKALTYTAPGSVHPSPHHPDPWYPLLSVPCHSVIPRMVNTWNHGVYNL